jgi:hypothetical protein
MDVRNAPTRRGAGLECRKRRIAGPTSRLRTIQEETSNDVLYRTQPTKA